MDEKTLKEKVGLIIEHGNLSFDIIERLRQHTFAKIMFYAIEIPVETHEFGLLSLNATTIKLHTSELCTSPFGPASSVRSLELVKSNAKIVH